MGKCAMSYRLRYNGCGGRKAQRNKIGFTRPRHASSLDVLPTYDSYELVFG